LYIHNLQNHYDGPAHCLRRRTYPTTNQIRSYVLMVLPVYNYEKEAHRTWFLYVPKT
jgi:hypothetical protein